MGWTHFTFLYMLVFLLPSSIYGLNLRLTNVITRHGSRTPTDPIPNDPFRDMWPQGYGQLTKVGIQQMYEVGQYLRSHYQGFINSTYVNNEIYVRSSNFDRTLMSGESTLAGLYPPSGLQIWNPNILWQPVPVHTVQPARDYLLDTDNGYCPQYDVLRQEVKETEEFKRNNASYEAYYEFLKNKTGLTKDMDPNDVWSVYDDMLARFENGLPVPDWVTPKQMLIMGDFFVVWEMANKFGGLEKGRIKGGTLMTQLVSNMNDTRHGVLDPVERKIFFYSGHDNNIVLITNITGTYNNRYVPLATALMVELYEDNSDFYVMMKFRNDTRLDPFILNITVCGGKSLCPLDEFIEGVKPYLITPEQLANECMIVPAGLNATSYVYIAIAIAIIAIIVLGAAIYLSIVGLKPRGGSTRKGANEVSPLMAT